MNSLNRETSRHRAYVLLMTLLLLPIVATSAVRVSMLSMRAALDAQQAQAGLRRHWGVVSCRAAVGPLAGQVLETANHSVSLPVTQVAAEFDLAGNSYHIVFADEQSKVNLNAVFDQQGMDATAACVRQMTDPTSPLHSRLNLRPASKTVSFNKHLNADEDVSEAPFSSFGQIFHCPEPELLLWTLENGAAAQELTDGPVSRMTLWGTGKLNFRRASTQAMQQFCDSILSAGEIDRIAQLRLEQPGMDLHALLNVLELPRDRRNHVLTILTNHSSCFSMWVEISDGHRTWRELNVMTDTVGDTSVVFRW